MADQTLILNVSDEMKLDDERQNCVGMESGEKLCSSSSDTTEELYSSSTTDTLRKCGKTIQIKEVNRQIVNICVHNLNWWCAFIFSDSEL